MFSKPAIKDLLNQYTLVQLYTDRVPPQYEPTTSADENRTFQSVKFGSAQLPLYVIVKPLPTGQYEEVARYEEGKINDVPGFTEFLRKHLATGQVTQIKTDGI